MLKVLPTGEVPDRFPKWILEATCYFIKYNSLWKVELLISVKI